MTANQLLTYSMLVFGVAVLVLFAWYFGTDDDKRKRLAGTVLSIVVTFFCLWVFVAPRDGRFFATLSGDKSRGDEGRWFSNIPLGIDLQGGNSFIVRIDPASADRPVTKDVQEQARAILEKRLNAYGTVDMAIIPQGVDRLEIQMPGIKPEDFQGVEDVITKIAKLEFRLVNPQTESLIAAKKSPTEPLVEPGWLELPLLREKGKDEQERTLPAGVISLRGAITEFKSKDDFQFGGKKAVATDATTFTGGSATDLALGRYIEAEGKLGGDKVVTLSKVHFTGSIVVKDRAEVNGRDVKFASPQYDANGYAVSLRLTAEGGKKMSDFTKDKVGQRMAIILDKEVISAPVIRDVLHESIQISGSFTQKQVTELASALNNPLENPLVVESKNQVSSSYGKDTISQGVLAGVAGLAGILLFMLIYYRMAGLIAILGLVVNTIILFGFMAVSHSTLTMLGIAGIILTVGMGVDANVLIYERLREELGGGKSLWAALVAAYDRAFSAIFDGHMTSLITAVILFMFAGGTIKGFAVSLTIGVLASLFGSLLVTRTLFHWFPNLKKLSFLDLIKNKNFDFMGKAKYWIGISVVSLIVTTIALSIKRENALGPDLRGGDKIVLLNHPSLTAEKVEAAAHKEDKSAVAQSKNTLQGTTFLEIRTSPEKGTAVLKAIEADLGENLASSKDVSVEKVGSQVGSEMLRTSFLALGAGVLAILLYLTLRFEFAFSLGVLVALFHDIVFCIGAIVVTGRDINLLQVGALLTIAGYSVTDTVVIFDRIREYFHTHKGDLKTIMNEAISSTLSRTLLTSVCTLITVVFLYFFGGPQLGDFAFTIVVGILVGTYSSIFVASPIVLWWANRRGHDLRGETLRAAESRALATQGLEREVAPRKL